MTNPQMITAAEATALLGYENRSSLTRLVQAGKIKPAFTASGKRGEQFFNPADIDALKLAAPSATPRPDGAASAVPANSGRATGRGSEHSGSRTTKERLPA